MTLDLEAMVEGSLPVHFRCNSDSEADDPVRSMLDCRP